MKRKWIIIGLIVLGLPALGLAWWLGSPLLLDTEVNEEFPMAASAEVPDDMTIEEVEAVMVKAADEPDTETTEPMPETVEPIVLSTAEFSGADDFHEGSGTATIYELEDGSRILRFEDFEVTNGPALRVILSPGDVDSPDDATSEGYIDLGELKGNVGDQNYELPADLDLDEFGTVVIYCEPFHVVFATAALNP